MRMAVIGSRGFPSTYGGFETFVRELVPRATAAGHEIIVYCRARRDGARTWREQGAECRFTRGIDSKHLSTLTFGLTSSWDARFRDLDVALVLNCANGYWLPLIEAAGIPVALSVDGLEWERGKWNRLGRAVFKLGAEISARRATRLISDSEAIAEIWQERFGVRPAYLPYGADVVADDAADELERLGIPPGEYVLTAARLVAENNVSMTIEGLDRLGEGNRPTHVIVGSAGGRSALEDRVADVARAREDVVWLGHVADQRLLTQLLRHCAVYVHGHSVGGTNPALLQALGAGAPTLCLDTAFNREVVGDMDVYYRDAFSLAEHLRRLLGSSALRERLSGHGRARVGERYSWRDSCGRYLALLEGLAGEAARSAE